MERMKRIESWSYAELVLANTEEADKGKLACLDTSSGEVVAGQEATGLLPIGYFTENKTGDGSATVRVQFFREKWIHRFDNSGTDAVAAADVGKLVYVEDDTTVSATDNTGARSAAGRAWKRTDSHVWVEMADSPTGLDA